MQSGTYCLSFKAWINSFSGPVYPVQGRKVASILWGDPVYNNCLQPVHFGRMDLSNISKWSQAKTSYPRAMCSTGTTLSTGAQLPSILNKTPPQLEPHRTAQ